jgi:hypothetical protein
MTPSATPERYKHHRFPAEIISHGVWLYYRFCLSYRDVEGRRQPPEGGRWHRSRKRKVDGTHGQDWRGTPSTYEDPDCQPTAAHGETAAGWGRVTPSKVGGYAAPSTELCG